MMPTLTFYFDFASPYSYLSAMRIEELANNQHCKIVWRPILLGPIFNAQGLKTSPFNIYKSKGQNMWRDMQRLTVSQGLPAFVKPDTFPQNGLLAARVATICMDSHWGPSFVKQVFAGQFAKGLTISEEEVVAKCLDDAGLQASGEEIAALIVRANTDDTVKLALRFATEEAQLNGVFGAPSFVTDDKELFWGNDRQEQALAWTNS